MKKITLCAISAAVLSFALANSDLMAQRPAARPAQGRPAAAPQHHAKPAPAPQHHAKPAPPPHQPPHHHHPAPPPPPRHHHPAPPPPPHHHHHPTTWGDLIGGIIDAAIHESRH